MPDEHETPAEIPLPTPSDEAVPLAGDARYLVQEKIGSGGMGQVFRAWDQHLGRYVAIKRISDDAGVDAAIRREASILAGLHHPNIVTIFDFASDDEGPFVVMEYVEGRNLEDIVADRPLEVPAFMELVTQICRGLASAHAAGLVHLDLKPGNIMLQMHRDGSFTLKILDFGLARAGHEETDGAEAELLGSPYTIAPEQLAREPTDARTDIYSLGCVFYFALSGRNPFEAPTVTEILQRHMAGGATPLHLIAPNVPQAMSLVIGKMISVQVLERPQTVEDVRSRLLKASRAPAPAHAAAPAPVRPGTVPRPGAASKPSKVAASGGGLYVALALIVLAGAVAWTYLGSRADAPDLDVAPAAAVAQANVSKPVVDPGDAAALATHRGEIIVVEGTVENTTESKLFHSALLKFANVPATGAVASVREDVLPAEKARSYVGKRVRATGKLSAAAGMKRVVIDSASDLTLAEQ